MAAPFNAPPQDQSALHDALALCEASQRKLKRKAAALRAAGRIAKLGAWEVDVATGEVFWSDETCTLLDAAPGCCRPLDQAMEIFDEADRAHVSQLLAQAIDDGEKIEFQARVTTFAGRDIWLRVSGEPEMVDGRCVALRGAAQDVTDHVTIEQSLKASNARANANAERLALALDGADAAVFEIDIATQSLWCSPRFEEIVGLKLTFDDAVAAARFVHPADLRSVRATLARTMHSGEPLTLEFRIRSADGRSRWVEARCQAAVGEPMVIRGLLIDTHDRKARALNLEAAMRSAEAATEAKSQFLSNISHEIRTPMNGVLGVLHLLRKEALSTEGRRLLDEASASGSMLSQLLDDIIDLSKIESGHLTLSPEPLNPGDVLRSVLALLRPTAEARGLVLTATVEGDGYVDLDPVRLRQMFFNLVGNAIKFTKTGSVSTRLTLTQSADEARLGFEVVDTGVGIPDTAKPLIFSRFQQADGAVLRRFGGSGLGLAITHRLVTAMGGEIGFTSRENHGSTFSFAIPAGVSTHAPADQFEENEALPLQDLTVLVVEDNATNRLVCGRILESLGASVDYACDGVEALEHLDEAAFDIVLMDIQMPRMDGLEATCRIRTGGANPNVPIVGLTANVMTHQQEAYLRAGMNAVVAKPIIVPDLVGAILSAVDPGPQRGSS